MLIFFIGIFLCMVLIKILVSKTTIRMVNKIFKEDL